MSLSNEELGKYWDAANTLREDLDAAEYKHIVLGLVFLKFISDAFSERREELTAEFANPKSDNYKKDEKADSPKLAQVFAWIAKGIKAGFIMNPNKTGGLGTTELWNSGKLVASLKGSWEINDTLKVKGGGIKFATQPGAVGGSKSMFNGLADSINAKSANQKESLEWVLFAGSAACQDIVASKHVVFPAIKTSTTKAFAAFKAAGVDIKGFTSVVDPKKTFIPPMAPNQAAVSAALKPYFEKIFQSQGDALSLLKQANKAANAALVG